MKLRRRRRAEGFTLIELLLVVGFIVIAMLLPVFNISSMVK